MTLKKSGMNLPIPGILVQVFVFRVRNEHDHEARTRNPRKATNHFSHR